MEVVAVGSLSNGYEMRREVVAVRSPSNGYDLARVGGQGCIWLWRRSWLLDFDPMVTTSRGWKRRSGELRMRLGAAEVVAVDPDPTGTTSPGRRSTG